MVTFYYVIYILTGEISEYIWKPVTLYSGSRIAIKHKLNASKQAKKKK
jgi:hypothetical protein